jgi:hypothetical protein
MKHVFAKGLTVLALSAACGAALADPVTYSATLSGAAEATPNDSPGLGAVIVTFDIDAHSLAVQSIFTGLTAGSTAAHIHCCTADPGTGTAGVATMTPTFLDFPTGQTMGVYQHTFDTSLDSFWNGAFVTANGGTTAGAEAALLAGLNGGNAYFNIHSSAFPNGEIRGFLAAPAPVPEPGMAGMLLLGIPAVVALGRRRKSKETS